MNLAKLSTKDWTSPRLRLINPAPAKSKQRVAVSCAKCNIKRELVYGELVRTVNAQSSIVTQYHCPSCYRQMPESINKRRQASKASIDKIKDGASKRSKDLWKNEVYKAKCLANAAKLANNIEFRNKVSKALKHKFANDPEYVKRTTEARKLYHKNKNAWDTAHFIEKASKVHRGKYAYNNTVYVSYRQKVQVDCLIHGSFMVRPSHHIHYENGCPQCNNEKRQSKGELELFEFISSIYDKKIIRSDRSVLNGMEIDIWIPDANLGIEYNGAWYHSCTNSKNKNYHSIKATIAHRKNINLMQFVDLDMHNKSHIVKSMIKNKLGINSKIYARNCQLREIDPNESYRFAQNNHYHGGKNATIAYGLYHKGNLISALSMQLRDSKAEIARFCTLVGFSVIGGFSRLLTHFIRHSPTITSITTYVDRCFTTSENCYSKFGMSFAGITKPGYRYLKDNKLYSRIKFQKHKLHSLLKNFDNNKTEIENMLDNGYRLLYDAGNLRYTYNIIR